MAEVLEIKGLGEVLNGLDNLRTDSKRMKRDLKKILRSVLSHARKAVSRDAKSLLPSDPRRAYAAVRHSVYKRILGGHVNILNRRRGAVKRMSIYRPPRKLRPGQRGGNRRPRSARTNQIDGYTGLDRGFILRIVNAGTDKRQTRYGNRGSIQARNWFAPSSQKAVGHAADEFAKLVERAIDEVWGES